MNVSSLVRICAATFICTAHSMPSRDNIWNQVRGSNTVLSTYLKMNISPHPVIHALAFGYFFDTNGDGVRNQDEKMFSTSSKILEPLPEGTIISAFVPEDTYAGKKIRYSLYDVHTGLIISSSELNVPRFQRGDSYSRIPLELFTLDTRAFKQQVLAQNRRILLPFRENPEAESAEVVRGTRMYAFDLVPEGDLARESGFFYIKYLDSPTISDGQ